MTLLEVARHIEAANKNMKGTIGESLDIQEGYMRAAQTEALIAIAEGIAVLVERLDKPIVVRQG